MQANYMRLIELPRTEEDRIYALVIMESSIHTWGDEERLYLQYKVMENIQEIEIPGPAVHQRSGVLSYPTEDKEALAELFKALEMPTDTEPSTDLCGKVFCMVPKYKPHPMMPEQMVAYVEEFFSLREALDMGSDLLNSIRKMKV